MHSKSQIVSVVEKLVKKCNTSNPYNIAGCLDITIIKQPLGNIWGFYKYVKRNKVIFINSELEDIEQKICCCHELGHAILHPHLNCPFMKANTFLITSKLEVEANLFAAYLMLYEADEEAITYEQIATALKVAENLVEKEE